MTVLIGGIGALLISRDVAIHQTQAFLLRSASALSILFARSNHRFVHPFLANTGVGHLRLITLGSSSPLPTPLSRSLINLHQIASGLYQSGVVRNTVYIVYPIASPTSQTHLGFATARPVNYHLALMLTRALPSLEGPAIFIFGAVIVGGAIAVVISDRYTAHISRTLDRLVDRSHRVAAGDLDDINTAPVPREAELAHLDEAISSMIVSLRSANEAEATYLLAISHDLRTPLTSIRGFAEAIIDEAVTSPIDAAHTIEREAKRIERLINDLTALARLRASDYALTPQFIDIKELLDHLIETATPRADLRSLILRSRTPAQAIEVETDPERLLQLLDNLLSNALKYARHEITVDVHHQVDAVNVAITDDGPGISPALKAQLFQVQLSPTPGRDGAIGSGLGLLIVGRLATRMGISVRVDSPITAKGGTRFVIAIPLASPGQQSHSEISPRDLSRR